jgi:hypothetical protein
VADTSLIFNLLGNPAGALKAAKAVGDGMASVAGATEDAMAKTSGKLSKAAGKWKGQLQTAGLAIGAVAGGAIMAGIAGAVQRGQDQLQLQAQLGIDKATARGVGSAAGKAYAAGFGESASANMQTARVAIQAGLAAATDTAGVQAAVQAAQTLATAYGVDVAEGARAAGQMLRTGMAANAQEAYDIIYAGLRGTGDLAGDLLDTWTEYGTQFRNLGLSGAQSMGILQQGARAGARDLDKVADAMKEFSIRAIDGSTRTAAGFKMIGLSSQDMAAKIGQGGPTAAAALDMTLDRIRAMPDPVKRAQAAVALFGTQAEDLGQALYALDPSSAVAAMGQVQGSVKAAGDTLQESGTARANKFKAALQQGLTDAMSAALPVAERLGSAITKHGDALQKAMPWLVGTAAVIGTVSVATKAWAAAQGVLTVAQGIATAATWAWNLALWANPITWVVAGVLLLVGVIVLIATKTTWFQTAWKVAWGGIKSAAKAVADWFTGPFVGFFIGVWDKIKGAWNGAVAWVKSLPGRISAALQALPGMLWGLVTGAFEKSAYAVGFILGTIVGFVIKLPGRIISALSSLSGMLRSAVSTAWNFAVDAVSNGITVIVGFALALPGRILSAVQALPGILARAMRTAWSAASSAVSAGIGWVINYVSTVPGRIWGILSGLPGRLWGLGSSIVRGLADGIRNAAGRLWDLAKSMASNFLGGFKRALGISSPSRVMHDLAQTGIVSGLVGGMQAGAGRVEHAGAGLLGPLTAGATGQANPAGGLAAGGGGGRIVLEIRSSGHRMSDMLVELLRDSVSVIGGGNVTVTVGR